MKCPHCGSEMVEGHLICEICGEEIRIVPDFEPEIENSITETLSTLVAEQDGGDSGKTQQADTVQEEEEEEDETDLEDIPPDGRKIWVMASLILFFVVALVTYSAYAYHIQTVDYQINKAREYAGSGMYAEAIACLEAAYEKNPEEVDLLFMEADYYYIQEDNEAAIRVLYKVIENGNFPYEKVEEAYDKIVTIYANQGLYGQRSEERRVGKECRL